MNWRCRKNEQHYAVILTSKRTEPITITPYHNNTIINFLIFRPKIIHWTVQKVRIFFRKRGQLNGLPFFFLLFFILSLLILKWSSAEKTRGQRSKIHQQTSKKQHQSSGSSRSIHPYPKISFLELIFRNIDFSLRKQYPLHFCTWMRYK